MIAVGAAAVGATAVGATAVGATAVGATAVGATAVGATAVGATAVGAVAVGAVAGSAAPDSELSADLVSFLVISAAYVVPCAIWIAARRAWPALWPAEPDPQRALGGRPWLDFVTVLAVVAASLGLGQLYRAGLLIPKGPGRWSHLTFQINTLLIYAPLFVALWLRRQPLSTVFVTRVGIARKVGAGVVLALVGLSVYLGLRGEPDRFAVVIAEAFTLHSAAHALPVFLEAVVVVFAFVRLRAAVGTAAALTMPCVLFAAAHVPRSLDAGRSGGEIAAFFALNTVLPMLIFYTVLRSRDVVWIGVIHYLLDVAIGAFR